MAKAYLPSPHFRHRCLVGEGVNEAVEDIARSFAVEVADADSLFADADETDFGRVEVAVGEYGGCVVVAVDAEKWHSGSPLVFDISSITDTIIFVKYR